MLDAPRGRLGDAAQDLEQRALAGAVAADDADDLALLHLEAHILQRPDAFSSGCLAAEAPEAAEGAARADSISRKVSPASRGRR